MLTWILAAVLAQAPAAPVERTVSLSVVDEKGSPVLGLTAEEVAVEENGAARTIVSFGPDRRPLRVTVLVDSSEPMGPLFRLHLVPAVAELLQQLPEEASVSVWTTGDRPLRLTEPGADRAAAIAALRRVFPRGGNRLLDAVVEASRPAGQEGGRHVMVAVTGLGTGFTDHDRRQVVEVAASALDGFHAVVVREGLGPLAGDDAQIAGLSDPSGVSVADYEFVLGSLAERTGGRRESALSAMGAGAALRAIAASIRGGYRLAYLSLATKGRPEPAVTVARPGARVRRGPVRP